MLILVLYQIKKNTTRYKLRKLLLGYGYSVQDGSVEMRLTNEQRNKIIYEIKSFENLLEPGDNIRFYQICRSCIQKSFVLGGKSFTVDPLFYLV
ncbi:MAG: CRISPR-associated endonuclease Cas2 [Ignavibacteria bacterium]|jgi:CRISPR-associated endonuclease Cas2|nr:CRISPR-associated endonuclease Cas2 [Ignavibacteria bacterium]